MWDSVGSCLKSLVSTFNLIQPVNKFLALSAPTTFIWTNLLYFSLIPFFIVLIVFYHLVFEVLCLQFVCFNFLGFSHFSNWPVFTLNFLLLLSFFCTAHYHFFQRCHSMWINLIYFYLPSFHFLHFLPYFISLLPSFLSVLDSWLSNKSFSPVEGAWSTLTWSLWPRNTSSFLLHMVGSLTELFHVSSGPVRSALIF